MPSKYIHEIRECILDDEANGLIVDFQGCPLNCRTCNAPLLRAGVGGNFSWLDVRSAMLKRRPAAVVFSGGEPLHNRLLPAYVHDVALGGKRVVVQTSAIYPERLARISDEVTFFEVNLVSPIKGYEKNTGVKLSGERVADSIRFLINNRDAKSYALTFVYHPWAISEKDLCSIIDFVGSLGAKFFVLKAFNRQGCNDPILRSYDKPIGLHPKLLKMLQARERKYGIKILTREM